MGVREQLNERPAMVAGAIAALVVLLAVIVWRESRDADGSTGPGSLYFTLDDGKSYFADAATRTTPFEKDGKLAVQAVLFSCDGNKTRFVGYLRRDAAAPAAATPDPKQPSVPVTQQPSYEVKRPGEANWVAVRSREGAAIRRSVHCADGKSEPYEVTP